MMLDADTRAFMEPRFGADLGGVRLHTDAAAERSAQAVCSSAYTVGHDIVFGAGAYAPKTHRGQRLLAHELTHVIQQSRTGSNGAPVAIQRQPAAGAQSNTAPIVVGLDVPPHPDAPTGINDWTAAYATPNQATDHNQFYIGTFRAAQICTFDDQGTARVWIYYVYDTESDDKYAVGSDSIMAFVASHGGQITAAARNTAQLSQGDKVLDPRKLPTAPDAFKEEPQLYYAAPRLPPYDVAAVAASAAPCFPLHQIRPAARTPSIPTVRPRQPPPSRPSASCTADFPKSGVAEQQASLCRLRLPPRRSARPSLQ
jgi:Domain of unknown function (DUF4157)